MGDEVEAALFLLGGDPQAHHGAHDPEDHGCANTDEAIADQHGFDVSHEQGAVATGGQDFSRFGEVISGHQGRSGQRTGEQSPHGAAHAVNGIGIEGIIELDGHDVTPLPMYRRARLGIGYLPQEASIFRGLNVEDNIRAVLEVAIRDKDQREAELEALLDEFDIKRLRKSPSIALSGGERRRCEIARALAGQPSYMLLDEPFAGIDPIAVGDIQVLVRHLKQRGIGVLITDHNVRETLGLIDRAYIIHSGHVLTEGSPEEIVANPDVRRYYLGEQFRM